MAAIFPSGSNSTGSVSPTTVVAVPMVSPGTRKPRSVSASRPPAEVGMAQPASPEHPPAGHSGGALPALPRPNLRSANNTDVSMTKPTRAGRARLVVPNRRKHSRSSAGCASRSVVAQSQCNAGSAACTVRRHGSTTTCTYRDVDQAPVRMQLTQSVKKSNDRSKNIPEVRPPLFRNDSDVSIFFSGNGLFPLFVDLTAQPGSGFDMMNTTPPAVRVFSFPDAGPIKRPKELDPHDWDMPSFKRVDSSTYVLKLGFKKAIGASRFFFMTVSVTSGDTTVTLTSNLFKVATKPRKLIIGNMDRSWTIAALRDKCPSLCELRARAGGRQTKTADRGQVDITGPELDKGAMVSAAASAAAARYAFAVMFRTPSRCLSFFAANYMLLYKMGCTMHLVPKRPLKMQPPPGLHHAGLAEVKIVASSNAAAAAVARFVPRAPVRPMPSSGAGRGAGAGAGAGAPSGAVPKPAELPVASSRSRSRDLTGVIGAPAPENVRPALTAAPGRGPVLPVGMERSTSTNPELEAEAAASAFACVEAPDYRSVALPLAELGIDLSKLSDPLSLPVAPQRSLSASSFPDAPGLLRDTSVSSIGTLDFPEMDNPDLDMDRFLEEFVPFPGAATNVPYALRIAGWERSGLGTVPGATSFSGEYESSAVICPPSPAVITPIAPSAPKKRRMTELPMAAPCPPASRRRVAPLTGLALF